MNGRTSLGILVSTMVLGLTPCAFADNTFRITVSLRVILFPPSIELRINIAGKPCVGTQVAVENTTDDVIHATVKDGDGTVLIDEDISSGSTSSSATLNNAGTGQVCVTYGAMPEECMDLKISENCFIIPTLSEWGAGSMVLLLLTAGSVVFGGRRRALAA